MTVVADAPAPVRGSLAWSLVMRQRASLPRAGATVFVQINALVYVASFTRALIDRVVVTQVQPAGAFLARGFVWCTVAAIGTFLAAQSWTRLTDRMAHDLRMWSFTRLTHRRDLNEDDALAVWRSGDELVGLAGRERAILLLVPVAIAPALVALRAAPAAGLVVFATLASLGVVVPRAKRPGPTSAAILAGSGVVLVALLVFLAHGGNVWPVHTRVSTGIVFVLLQSTLALIPLGIALARLGAARDRVEELQQELVAAFAPAVAPRSWGAHVEGPAALRVRTLGVRLSAKPGELVDKRVADATAATVLARTVAGILPSDDVDLGGTPVHELDPADRLEQVRLLAQQSLFVPGTLRENLSLGRLDDVADDAALGAVLSTVGLPDLDTPWDVPIDDFDATFDLAQRQRLAVARALLGDLRLLVLDNALSALSTKDAASLLRAVRDVAPTAIVVNLTSPTSAPDARPAPGDLRDRFVRDVLAGTPGATGGLDDEVRARFADESWELHRTRWMRHTLASAQTAVLVLVATLLPLIVLANLGDRALRTGLDANQALVVGMFAAAVGLALRTFAALRGPR